MAGNLSSDIEAQSMIPPLHDVPASPGVASARYGSIDQKHEQCHISPVQLETSTINIWEIALVLLLAIKFMLFPGKEELSVNVYFCLLWALVGFTIFVMICQCFCCNKGKIVLPSHGAHIIRLVGLLILFSNHVYGFLQKEDVFFGYKYNHDSAFNIIVAAALYMIDLVTVYWFICVIYTCFTYLRNLNNAHQPVNAVNK